MRSILVSAAILVAIAAHADWKMDPFMISLWGGPVDEATAKTFADAGFNTVMAPYDKLELCRKYGLKAMVMNATPEMAAKHKDDPAIWGWFVRDEPQEKEFKDVAVPVAKLQEADPNHPAYVNLMAWMNLKAYIDTVKPRFLSYDYYQWWWGTQNQFGRLEVHRKAALEAKIPLICWVEANADPRWEWGKPGATYLPDNQVKLRQSVYTALVYGVKGIQWFVESLIFEHDKAGKMLPKLQPAGEDIKAINGELQALGPTLVKLTSTGVYHTDPVPPGGSAFPADLWVQAKGRHLTLGLFTDEAGTSYIMVVNRDITMKRPVTLSFGRPVAEVDRFDRQTRQWVSMPEARMMLKAGDGELLRVE
jgi:hypothetical protein